MTKMMLMTMIQTIIMIIDQDDDDHDDVVLSLLRTLICISQFCEVLTSFAHWLLQSYQFSAYFPATPKTKLLNGHFMSQPYKATKTRYSTRTTLRKAKWAVGSSKWTVTWKMSLGYTFLYACMPSGLPSGGFIWAAGEPSRSTSSRNALFSSAASPVKSSKPRLLIR